MHPRAQILLPVLLVLVGFAIFVTWQWLQFKEPIYQGKPLSVWLEMSTKQTLMSGSPDDRAVQAIRHIGTNALPVLIGMLRAHDSLVKQFIMAWVQKQKLVHFNFRSADQRRADAICGYMVLGPLASPQIPDLINCLTNDSSPKVRMAAASALGSIGPGARLAGPALFRAVKDTDGLVRNNSLWALSQILPDPKLTIPVLIEALDDSNRTARENAAIALGKYGEQAKVAVPVLLRKLRTNRSASQALKLIDPTAVQTEGVP